MVKSIYALNSTIDRIECEALSYFPVFKCGKKDKMSKTSEWLAKGKKQSGANPFQGEK